VQPSNRYQLGHSIDMKTHAAAVHLLMQLLGALPRRLTHQLVGSSRAAICGSLFANPS